MRVNEYCERLDDDVKRHMQKTSFSAYDRIEIKYFTEVLKISTRDLKCHDKVKELCHVSKESNRYYCCKNRVDLYRKLLTDRYRLLEYRRDEILSGKGWIGRANYFKYYLKGKGSWRCIDENESIIVDRKDCVSERPYGLPSFSKSQTEPRTQVCPYGREVSREILDRIAIYLYFEDVVAMRSVYIARARLRFMSLELIIAFVRLDLSMDDVLWMVTHDILPEKLFDAICLKY